MEKIHKNLALQNIKNNKKDTILFVILVSLSAAVFWVSGIASDLVNKFTSNITDIYTLKIFGYPIVTESNPEEYYEKLKKDERFCEVGSGNIMDLPAKINNADEICDDGSLKKSMIICRLYDICVDYTSLNKQPGLYEILVPRYIDIDDPVLGYEMFTKRKVLDGKDFVGKTIKVTIEESFEKDDSWTTASGDFEFKIVGTIDNYKTENLGYFWYISPDTFTDIEKTLGNEDYEDYVYAILSDTKYIDEVSEFMAAKAYVSEETLALQYSTNAVDKIGSIVSTMCIVVLVNYAVISIKKRETDFAVMRAMGYNVKDISKMLLYELIFKYILGIIIAAAGTLLTLGIWETVKQFIMNKIYINVMRSVPGIADIGIVLGAFSVSLLIVWLAIRRNMNKRTVADKLNEGK